MSDAQFKRIEGRFCGVGGQGIVLGSTIIADAAIFYEGKYAVQSPTFGSRVRGGPTKVDFIIDTEEIVYPKATNINFFLAIAQISFNKYFYDIADDAVILLDENLVADVPKDILEGTNRKLFRLPVLEMAKNEFKNVILGNMISLGITQEMTQAVSLDHLLMSVEKLVPPKHLAKNLEAVKMGVQLAQERQPIELSA